MVIKHAPVLTIAIPLLSAFLTPLLGRLHERIRDAVAMISVLLSLAFTSLMAQQIWTNGSLIYTLGSKSPSMTLPSGYKVPVRIILQADGMTVLMALTTSFIGVIGVWYSLSYMRDRGGSSRYYSLLLLLIAGMFGMELTGDAFNLFVFLEVTSIAACGLIGFNLNRGEAQEAAFKTLALYTVGALLFLFAVGILYGQYNALNLGYLAQQISFNFLDKVTLTLFVVALSMKVGAVPMHMWVPDAYSEAHAPVSLVLVSNTLVSLYALYRISFNLFGAAASLNAAGWILLILGTMSIFIGVSMAFLQKKIKRLLAYCALSQVGYMLLGVGVGLALLGKPGLQKYGLVAIRGGLFHIVNDALYMGLLFLAAGAVIYRTGERKMSEVSGLGRSMKWTSVFMLIGTGAIAGLPPFNGFASKLMIYESVFQFSPLLSIIAIIASILTLAVVAKAFYSSFLGPELPELSHVKEVPKAMTFSMAFLSIVIILIGLFPNFVVTHLVDPAADALVNQSDYVSAVMSIAGGSG